MAFTLGQFNRECSLRDSLWTWFWRRASVISVHAWPLRWRHNELGGVSDHQPHDCLLNRLFGRRSKKTSNLCVTGLCPGNSLWTGEFPAQMASNAENVSIWWRHHDIWGHCQSRFGTNRISFAIELLHEKPLVSQTCAEQIELLYEIKKSTISCQHLSIVTVRKKNDSIIYMYLRQ